MGLRCFPCQVPPTCCCRIWPPWPCTSVCVKKKQFIQNSIVRWWHSYFSQQMDTVYCSYIPSQIWGILIGDFLAVMLYDNILHGPACLIFISSSLCSANTWIWTVEKSHITSHGSYMLYVNDLGEGWIVDSHNFHYFPLMPPPPTPFSPAYLVGNEKSLALQLVGLSVMHHNHLGWLVQWRLQQKWKINSLWSRVRRTQYQQVGSHIHTRKFIF